MVHGIGEQKPLETLLRFVGDGSGSGILPPSSRPRWFINPDSISGRTYSRRISVDTRNDQPEQRYPIQPKFPAGSTKFKKVDWARTTTFYEYYWAYRFRDTSWKHLIGWVSGLILRRSALKNLSENETLIGNKGRVYRLLVAALMLVVILLAPIGGQLFVNQNYLGVSDFAIRVGAILLAVLATAGYFWAINSVGLIWYARGLLAWALIIALIVVVLVPDWSTEEFLWERLLWAALVGVAAALSMVIAARIKSRQKSEDSASGRKETYVSASSLRRRLLWYGLPGAIVVGAFCVALWTAWVAFQPLAVATSIAAPVASILATTILAKFLLGGVGDAARYLSNEPDNIREREKIRSGLVRILRTLHEEIDPTTGRPMFDKIVLVGHSLGSVIAYDALHSYFSEVSRKLPLPLDEGRDKVGRDKRAEVIQAIEKLLYLVDPPSRTHEGAGAGKGTSQDAHSGLTKIAEGGAALELWVAAQRDVQRLLRDRQDLASNQLVNSDLDGRWIVSDFVTLGSPLAHAELLLADGAGDLIFRRRRRIIPSNPPTVQVTDRGRTRYRNTVRYEVKGPKIPTAMRIHHAGVFAVTTWTNIYFPHDLIGGPVCTVLGNGIRDYRLPSDARPRPFDFLTAYPHSSYWPSGKGVKQQGLEVSLEHLRKLILSTNNVLLVSGDFPSLCAARGALGRYREADRRSLPDSGSCVEVRMLQTGGCPGSNGRAWAWAGTKNLWPSYDAYKLIEIMEREVRNLRAAQLSDGSWKSDGRNEAQLRYRLTVRSQDKSDC
ncbi:hypothetical protein G6031_12090 [Dietzia sp. CQ4]|uniref:hypothetical protein n=1 Tax=Dietzia sp. (strain CQ4) TaxID=370437 RepID=UPI0015FD586F|nr:hypothetical protein [Dietzia sp. CQ4]MBB1035116.1 hypothetical protein [Dietzia sp. CQ4]